MADHLLVLTAPITLTFLAIFGNTGSIPIGAIFDSRDVISQKAFDYALEKHKKQGRQRDPYFQFNLTSDSINISDNFQLASAICRQMSQGVFAILGQKSIQSADIVKSLTSTFHMPYITPSLSPSSLRDEPSSYEIHLRPDLTAAIVDVIEILGWRHVFFMYDSDEGLHRLQHIHKMMRNDQVQWFSMVRFANIDDVHDELKSADLTDSFGHPKSFVLDLSSEEAYSKVLRQIPEVGMNKAGYNYLLGTLDFLSLNLSRFRHGAVNVTGFQLLESSPDSAEDLVKDIHKVKSDEKRQSSHGLPVHAALTVDGLRVIESAISAMLKNDSDVFRWIFRRGELYNLNKTRGIPCTTKPPAPWMFGPRLLETMKQGRSEGLSGTLTFNEDGYRKDFTLGVYWMALDVGLEKIGTWTPNARFVNIFTNSKPDSSDNTLTKEANSTLIITSILTAPFLMKKEVKPGDEPLTGNDQYEGFSMDLAIALGKIVDDFTFVFHIVADGNYGSRPYGNNTWNGIMGELLSGKADLAVAPLTITAERERFVDFSKHFMDIGVTIMIKKPASVRPGVFSFMEPLSLEVWICIILAYVTVSVGLFLVTRFSPLEWRKIKIGEFTYHNDFSLINSFWFAMGALMFQGSDNCPRSVSGRVIGGAWWFFVLISISSYTANLAAFLTIERMITPIESADDLVNHPTIKYGAVASGSTLQFFVNSDVPVYRQMGDYMMSHPEVLVQTNEEGIDRVLKSKGKYAFLAESPLVEYVKNRKPCDTTDVGGMLNNKGFGIATPRNSPFRDPVNVAVLKLKEEGILYNLHQKWWVEKGQCGAAHSSKKGKMSLSLSNLAGIFYILIVGLVIAISLGIIEFVCFRAKFKSKDTITGEGYLRGTTTFSTLCSSPVDKKDSRFYYDTFGRRTSQQASHHDGLEKKSHDASTRPSTDNLTLAPPHE
ncbi:hypothetical protein BsWGS_27153 [Bradybaena similaris]